MRPQLEYCVQFWLPCYIKSLPSILKRLGSMAYEKEVSNYQEVQGLFSFEKRKMRGDFIKV